MVSLKEIAQRTGYSLNTVSRALRGSGEISAETKKYILQTAEEMGYIVNDLASSLRRGTTKTIGIIVSDISNPYFAVMVKEIEKIVAPMGNIVIVFNTNEDEEKELRAIKAAISKKADGIIICPTQKSDKNILFLKKARIPFVLFGRCFKNIETNYVISDDRMGGYKATRALIENGHKNILFINAPAYISSSVDRLSGYMQAHEEAGIPVNAGNIYHIDFSPQRVYRAIVNGEIKIGDATAIFCFSDMMAQECIFALKQIGLSVPGDISVVGFDHIQSRILSAVNICSIATYKGSMFQAATDILFQKINQNDTEIQQKVFDVDFTEGETIRKINQ